MADYPALPLWTDRYLSDTRHLTTAEHGAYLLLLMEAWRRPSCTLPDNDGLLAKLAGASVEEWALLRPAVMAFWRLDRRTKEWSQKTLTKERNFVTDRSMSQRGRAAKRWNKTKKGDAGDMPDRYPTDAPTPTPTPRSKDILESAFDEFWKAYPARDGSNPRSTAENAYSKALRDGATHADILAGAKAYAIAQRREHGSARSRFTAQASTWLNQKRWRDEAPPPAKAAVKPLRELTREDWQRRLDYCRPRGEWLHTYGPPPFAPGCLVPADLLIERDRTMTVELSAT